MSKKYGRNAWIALGVVLGLGAIVQFLNSSEPTQPTAAVKPARPAKTVEAAPEKKSSDLTSEELSEFDLIVLDLDPEQVLVSGMSQWEDSEIVNVTVASGFIAAPQIQQGEIAISMRDGLAKVCECSPSLRFQPEGGQRLVDIGRGQPKYKQ